MSGRPTIACVIGTRPEAIKMAPVIAALRAAGWARCMVVATAQHRGLLDQMLDRFAITVDHDLDLMTEGQAPADLVARFHVDDGAARGQHIRVHGALDGLVAEVEHRDLLARILPRRVAFVEAMTATYIGAELVLVSLFVLIALVLLVRPRGIGGLLESTRA